MSDEAREQKKENRNVTVDILKGVAAYLETLLEPIRQGEADVVIGSRFLEGEGRRAVMIPATLRISLIAAVVCYFIAILYFLKQRALNLKYTLLWLVVGFVMGLLVAIPELLVSIIRIFGIQNNMEAPSAETDRGWEREGRKDA